MNRIFCLDNNFGVYNGILGKIMKYVNRLFVSEKLSNHLIHYDGFKTDNTSFINSFLKNASEKLFKANLQFINR